MPEGCKHILLTLAQHHFSLKVGESRWGKREMMIQRKVYQGAVSLPSILHQSIGMCLPLQLRPSKESFKVTFEELT